MLSHSHIYLTINSTSKVRVAKSQTLPSTSSQCLDICTWTSFSFLRLFDVHFTLISSMQHL